MAETGGYACVRPNQARICGSAGCGCGGAGGRGGDIQWLNYRHAAVRNCKFEYASKRIARMSDGNILVSYGRGWSQYGKLKPGIDPVTSAREAQAKYDARPVEFHLYIKALMSACALEMPARCTRLSL